MWVSTAIRAGLATGITAAFTEIAANLLKAPPVLASPGNLAIVVGSSIAVLVTGHVLAWLVTERGLHRLTGEQARSIQGPVRLGVATFLVLLPVVTTVRMAADNTYSAGRTGSRAFSSLARSWFLVSTWARSCPVKPTAPWSSGGGVRSVTKAMSTSCSP